MPTGLNYQGRDGELRLLDKSEASATTAGTPWGLIVKFEQMDLSIGMIPRPEEMLRMDRERLSDDMHHQVGSDAPIMSPFPVTFSTVMSSTETDALMEFVGIEWARKETASTTDVNNPWTVKGTPNTSAPGAQRGLTTTKGRNVRSDGLYDGGRIDSKGSAFKTPVFADKKKVAVDMEVLFSERDLVNRFGYRVQEVHFPPGEQRVAESADFVTVTASGQAYGMMTRITSFSRLRDIMRGGLHVTT